MPQTVRFHRVFTAPPERLFRAFTEPDARCKWLPPHGFTGTFQSCDPVVGGHYQMSFRNFSTGHSHSFGGTHVELVPNTLVKYTARFDAPNLPGEMTTTVVIRAVAVGTEIEVVQEGIPDVIPAEACCLGWQESLAQLALLVNPEIPG
jgi:uncharacterized protein YndB with AHSA1/START domain